MRAGAVRIFEELSGWGPRGGSPPRVRWRTLGRGRRGWAARRSLWIWIWVWVCWPAPAAAQSPCASSEGPWVGVQFVGETWGEAAQAEVLEHLRAGLSQEGLTICRSGSRPDKPVAVVRISRKEPGNVALTIDVQDGITRKRVVRDVDLHEVPVDGRALGVALAADELLRASWVELALESAPEPAEPPPPVVRRTVERRLATPYRPKRKALGLEARAASSWYSGGQTHVGGELAFRGWFVERFGAEVALGLERALPIDVTLGTIDGIALGGSVSLLWNITMTRPVSLQAEAGAALALVRLQGQPGQGAEGAQGSGLSAYARLGPVLDWRIAEGIGLRVRAGAGAPISTVAAEEGDETVTAVSGAEVYGGIGFYGAF